MYEKGRRHFSGNLTAFYLRRSDEVEAPNAVPVRIGFTVGRALGGSVERNRIRRRVREAVRLQMGSLGEIASPVDIVINPKKSVLRVDFTVLSDEVSRALQTIRQKLDRPEKQ